jgi:Uma2 family endonuclease
MSEQEFLDWCGPETRAEWVDGEVVMMAPVSFRHADLSAWLLSIIRMFVRRRDLGVAVGGELYVRLSGRRRLPDVLFVSKARLGIVKENHVEGAPDLIMEIVSPESESRDWRDKYLDYERAGVTEYWVIDPASKHTEVYVLTNGKFAPVVERDGKIASTAIPGFYLQPQWLWQNPLPSELDVLHELGV